MVAQVVDVRRAEDVRTDGNAAGLGLVKTLEERGHRRLAATGGADDRNALVLLDLDEEVFEYGDVGALGVREGDVGEGDRAGKIRGEDALGLIGSGGELEKLVEVAGSAGGLRDTVGCYCRSN